MTDQIKIGDAELELLRHVCDVGPSSIKELHESYGEPRGIHRGTVLQMAERLRKKGLLLRTDVAKILHYRSALERKELERRVIATFIDQRLGGSFAPFVHFLASTDSLTVEEEAQLKELISKLERKKEP